MNNRIHAIQLDTAWEDRAAGFGRVEALLDGRAIAAGDLLVLPEMFAVGFTMNVAAVAEDEGGATERFLCGVARRHAAYLVAGVPLRSPERPGKGRNTAVVVSPEGVVVARYVKRHPFSFAGETDHYEAGKDYVLFDWHGLRVAPLICYDLRFPESFRVCVCRGAEVFAVIANWPDARREHWRALLVARAIENQAYVIGVNRVGRDPSHAYAGDSVIVGPRGDVLADAGTQAAVVGASPDAAVLRAYREQFPALRDMGDGFRPGMRRKLPSVKEPKGAWCRARSPRRAEDGSPWSDAPWACSTGSGAEEPGSCRSPKRSIPARPS